jgi:hypothetical protein
VAPSVSKCSRQRATGDEPRVYLPKVIWGAFARLVGDFVNAIGPMRTLARSGANSSYLDSERFRSTPRTCVYFGGSLRCGKLAQRVPEGSPCST